MTTLVQAQHADLDCSSTKAFEGVFAKRDNAETSDRLPAGVFDRVFVTRGRWRKNQPEASHQSCDDVLRLAEHVTFGVLDLGLSKITDPISVHPDKLPCVDPAAIAPESTSERQPVVKGFAMLPVTRANQFVVKNTFINGRVDSFDTMASLKGFLLEREVQSCPAGSINIDDIDMTEVPIASQSESKDVEYNTASTYRDLDDERVVDSPAKLFHIADFLPSVPSTCADTSLAWQDLTFDTALTFDDVGFERMLQNTSGVGCELDQLPWDAAAFSNHQGYFLPSDLAMSGHAEMHCHGAAFEDQQQQMIETRGSEIQQRIVETAPDDQSQGAALHAKLCNIFAPAASMPAMGVLAPLPPPPISMAPMAAPVLRLAEILPPLELGSQGLPSMGSMLHHRGGCRPCTFFHTRGCENAEDCPFCHLCLRGEKKKRLRAQRSAKREAKYGCYDAALVESTEDDFIVE